jgi:hypothetical protein
METKNNARDWWIIGAVIAVFALAKLSTLHFRFGDENVYFYMSDAILRGFIPHKDFFLADPPFFIYMMAGFKALFGSHLILFKTLPIFFDILSAILIYLLLKDRNSFAILGPIFYLASFTVLSTSDYVTGAEIMIPFVLLAFLLDQKGKPFWSGVSWALAALCKLYAAPALIGFLIYKFIAKEFSNIKNIILGGLVTTIIIMAPFFILAPHQTFYNLITHQFNRPAGLNKWNIFAFFVKFEWLLITAAIWGAFKTKYKLWIYPLIFSAVFFLLYKDLYFLYLHILMPFIAILAVECFEFLNNKRREFAWIFMALFIAIFLYSSSSYMNTYQPQGILQNPEEIAEALKNAPDDFPVYGVQEVAPLVALQSGRKIFNNVIDTNTQNFAAGTHNLNQISQDAVRNGIYLVARIADYPDQNIRDTGFEGYFSPEIFKSSCVTYKDFARPSTDSSSNKVVIYRCSKNY